MPPVGHVAAVDTPWVDVPGGQRRLVYADVEQGVWALGVRFELSSGTERHRHTGQVYAWTISGCWLYEEYGERYEAGSFVHETAGSTHTLIVPADNTEITEVLFVVHGTNQILDFDDNVVRINDAAAFSRRYRDLCVAQGFSVTSPQ